MPTQEERLTTLGQDTKVAIQDINHNISILKGVVRSQGLDIIREYSNAWTL
jgi:hypothetical protein